MRPETKPVVDVCASVLCTPRTMSSGPKLNGRPSRFNPPLAKKMTSPEKQRDAWEQTKRNEGLPFPKTMPGHYNSRLSQRKPSQMPGQYPNQELQKETLLPAFRDMSQPALSGADGKVVEEVQPEVTSSIVAQETSMAESEKEPLSVSEKVVERNLGHVIRSLWRSMSSMFNTAPAVHLDSSIDMLSDDGVDAEEHPKSRSLSLGDHMPNLPGAAKSQGNEEKPATRLPLYMRRSRGQVADSRVRLNRSISQSNDVVVAQLNRATRWQKRDLDAGAFSDNRRANSSSTLRKKKSPRRARSEKQLHGARSEDAAVRREKRVKERGSPVDSKKFRLVLKKFQKVLKEESKRLSSARPDQSSLVINRAKSMVSVAEWGGHRGPHPQPGYGRKSLTSLSPSGRIARELAGGANSSSAALRKTVNGWRGERPVRSAVALDHGRDFFSNEGISSISNTDLSALDSPDAGIRESQRSPYNKFVNAQYAASLSPARSTVRASPDGQRIFGREQTKDNSATPGRFVKLSQVPSPVSPVRNGEASDVDNPNESSSSV
ncbi:hypothetical protein Btru_046581 [Bulinus truncatus]|nr:hypothetical protein Btru_046581 [Bulinus truncatus]